MAVLRGKAYNEIEVGDEFSASLTVTETHLVLAAGMFGDFHPLHTNQSFAEDSRYGGRILHGVFTSALIGSVAGQIFHGTGVAYLEHSCRFTAPVRPGDTLTTAWTVREKIDKPNAGGGIAVMSAVCRNQDDVIVAEADGKMLVQSV
ncbi:MAG TPA: MaoC family dehydratase [Burkholderiales bacterium]|nr:MaoC family dehydratase [Burkholderiales bacterium]